MVVFWFCYDTEKVTNENDEQVTVALQRDRPLVRYYKYVAIPFGTLACPRQWLAGQNAIAGYYTPHPSETGGRPRSWVQSIFQNSCKSDYTIPPAIYT